MSKKRLTDVEICRIHDLHKLGVPNTKIADEFAVSERTVRYHLGKPEPELGHGAFSSLSKNEVNRKDSIVDILDKQILVLSSKLQEAEDIKISKPSDFTILYADSSHSGENERLEEAGICVEQVYFSTLKDDMVENLLFHVENHNLKVSSELTELKSQLMQYHRVKKRSGRTAYSKVNDDCVDSLMLALWGLKEGYGYMDYWASA